MRSSARRQQVVVVGAGLGGLSAACHLAGAGHDVTVAEAAPESPAAAGTLSRGGYRFDTGPTVLTMPHLIERCLVAAGVDPSGMLDVRPVDPMYRACFADGSELRVRHGREAMTEEIRSVCGSCWRPSSSAGSAPGSSASTTWRCPRSSSAATTRPSTSSARCGRPSTSCAWGRSASSAPLCRATSRTSGCTASSASRRCTPVSHRTKHSPSTPSSPTWTPSTACSSRSVGCTSCPRRWPRRRSRRGRRSPTTRASSASSSRTGRPARSAASGSSAARSCPPPRWSPTPTSPRCTDRSSPGSPRHGPSVPARTRRRRSSGTSALAASLPASTEHHNIHFGKEWDGAFKALLRDGVRMPDPSLLVSVPSLHEPTMAPAGAHALYVLGARAEPGWPRRLARPSGDGREPTCEARPGGRARLPDGHRGRGAGRPPRLGGERARAGHAVRAVAPLPPDRPVPSGATSTVAHRGSSSADRAPYPAWACRWCSSPGHASPAGGAAGAPIDPWAPDLSALDMEPCDARGEPTPTCRAAQPAARHHLLLVDDACCRG